MIKSYVLHGIPVDHIAAMERWYYKDHAPEIAGRFGPWAVRMDSYLPIAAPPEAARFGYINWRMTEVWWREMMQPGASGAMAFTAPPVPAQVNEMWPGLSRHRFGFDKWTVCRLINPPLTGRHAGRA